MREMRGMTYPWEEGLNPHVPRVETHQAHPAGAELSPLGYSGVLEAAGLWAGRRRAHPAGKGSVSLPLPWSLCLKQTEELGRAQLPNDTWLLLAPCAVDRERDVFGWKLDDLQILLWRWFLLITFPTDTKASWISRISHWGQVTKVFVRHYLVCHVHCSILCPAQWILPGSAQIMMDPKQSILPGRS